MFFLFPILLRTTEGAVNLSVLRSHLFGGLYESTTLV